MKKIAIGIIIGLFVAMSIGWIAHYENAWLDDSVISNCTVDNSPIGSSTPSTIVGTSVTGTSLTDGTVSISGGDYTSDEGEVEVRNLNADLINYAGCSMSGDSLTLTTTASFDSLLTGLYVICMPESANTGTTFVNVDGLGWKAVKEASDDSVLESGDFVADVPLMLFYNGTDWIQISQSGN
ncbi:MAG: hypothetical protein KGY74_05325 [Candidatus Cloacimonetes bacterium]|nr:hypothetical protein [Candidatus Cloacimonadota bacterium]